MVHCETRIEERRELGCRRIALGRKEVLGGRKERSVVCGVENEERHGSCD